MENIYDEEIIEEYTQDLCFLGENELNLQAYDRTGKRIEIGHFLPIDNTGTLIGLSVPPTENSEWRQTIRGEENTQNRGNSTIPL